MKRKLPTVLPRLAHTVPHVTQLDSWDCGLACLAMVLAGAHNSGLIADDPTKTNPLSLRTIMEASGAGESVWTIDLAYIMRHFGIDDFTFYTSYIGVNLQYTGKHFYRESISNDRRRIHSLFAEAQDFGVRVVPMVLSMEDMRRFLLSEHYAILILVNLRKLKCRVCSRHHGSSSSPFSHDFMGHYVLLIGYDPETDGILVRDPGTEEGVCFVDASVLDAARSAPGTDHDAIVVRVR
ncbi:Guanylyl cyclase [Chytridium lagenaria]|nr:Guanylyl cyclase [Chytridium lagenaria]